MDKKDLTRSQRDIRNVSRRTFVKTATIAGVAASVPLAPLLRGRDAVVKAAVVPYGSAARAAASLNYRRTMADAQNIDVGTQPDNGDWTSFTDFSGNYSKGLAHDAAFGMLSALATSQTSKTLSWELPEVVQTQS